MEGDLELDETAPPTRVRHIKKRALKNKGLSVSFNEKDLRDFVDGFHKRKKKRRKEAQKQQEETLRKKRIEARKKRKLEEQFVAGAGQNVENEEEGEEVQEPEEPDASVSGTMTYDTGDLKVTVTTSEISHEEDEANVTSRPTASKSVGRAPVVAKQPVPVKKTKTFKKARKKRKSGSKPEGKRDKRKRSKQNKKSR
ncbi:PREDICTED: ribosomal RNA-processing protein 17 [Tarenaya hassleriana]|uniref:ribosomal RNA-processing protein 17 n=1 Tax=Tarenaya hassleriana TaxID=28532 RepID=UPI00053C4B1A|nr:PREDICTED: ribosomal RNA-processing protein 17 [Tarenaya hassleriana]